MALLVRLVGWQKTSSAISGQQIIPKRWMDRGSLLINMKSGNFEEELIKEGLLRETKSFFFYYLRKKNRKINNIIFKRTHEKKINNV